MSQTAQEEGDTNEGITTVMALWIDNSTIAFTTNNSVNILHLGSYIHLYSSCGEPPCFSVTSRRARVDERLRRCYLESCPTRNLPHLPGYTLSPNILPSSQMKAKRSTSGVQRYPYHSHRFNLIHDTAEVFPMAPDYEQITCRLSIEETRFLRRAHEQPGENTTT